MDFMSPRFGEFKPGRETLVLRDEAQTDHAVNDVMTMNCNSPHGSEMAPSMVQRVIERRNSREDSKRPKVSEIREINLKETTEKSPSKTTGTSRNTNNGLELIQTLDKEELKSYLQHSRNSGVGAITVNKLSAAKTQNTDSREMEALASHVDKKWKLAGDFERAIAEVDSAVGSKTGDKRNESDSSRHRRQNIFI